jgi:hypothetical protein
MVRLGVAGKYVSKVLAKPEQSPNSERMNLLYHTLVKMVILLTLFSRNCRWFSSKQIVLARIAEQWTSCEDVTYQFKEVQEGGRIHDGPYGHAEHHQGEDLQQREHEQGLGMSAIVRLLHR